MDSMYVKLAEKYFLRGKITNTHSFSQDEAERIIILIRHHPCLYDSKNNDYQSRTLLNNLYENINQKTEFTLISGIYMFPVVL